MAKKKYVCIGCHKCTEPCTVELSGDADMTKDPNKMLHCGTWLEVPAEEDTNKEQLPKLTAEVFSLDGCPKWAQYAAVDPDGEAYWYDGKPRIFGKAWNNESGYRARLIGRQYDASDWKSSCIERPVEKRLPKLTADVFSMDECPLWARYAAVDENGRAYWYDEKPMLVSQAWAGTGTHFARPIERDSIWLRYDASDWKTSLLERPVEERLPKITDAVFRLSECPDWAQYAAVDAEGSAYWYAAKPDLGSQAWCNISKHFVARRITLANMPIRYDKADWKSSLIERPAELRTKLTYAVFSLPECPEWAQFAAVDADGVAYWYDTKPEQILGGWLGVRQRHTAVPIARGNTKLFYDSSDWKNSLIERFTKLTEEIFNHPDCPADAVVAVVNASGTAAWGNCADIVCDEGLGAFCAVPDSADWTGIPGGACFDATDWQHSAVYRSGVQLERNELEATKLTAKVFSMPECPVEARYAAVDSDGTAYWYREKPMRMACAWNCTGTDPGKKITRDGTKLRYDSTDWKNSLIERPAAVAPKLTVDVFALPQCPGWARYAAVDACGDAYWYEAKPRLCTALRFWDGNGLRANKLRRPDSYSAIMFDASDWEYSLIERQPAEPRQKLTAGVFSLSECPEWARYAAVDASGLAYWYDDVPRWSTDGFCWQSTGKLAMKICYAGEVAVPLFDATDWEHSLIERPSAVPKWFKPGVLAYNIYTHTFLHVTDSTEYHEKYLEAKVRPFSADELERLFGQSVLGPNGSKLLVTGFYPDGVVSNKPEICVLGDLWLTAEELLTYGSRPQGINQYHSKEGTWIDCGLSS